MSTTLLSGAVPPLSQLPLGRIDLSNNKLRIVGNPFSNLSLTQL
jgi:hypothetical protein